MTAISGVTTYPFALRRLQAARGIAAVAVLVHHCGQYVAIRFGISWLLPGSGLLWSGVDVFFVLSGFLMAWTSFETPASVRGSAAFLIARLGRIYPPYWIALLFTLGVVFALPLALPKEILCPSACQISLLPFGGSVLLGPAWTLSFELIFYLAFSVLLLFPVRLRLGILCLWTIVIVGSGLLFKYVGDKTILHVAITPLTLEFLLGIWVALALRSGISAVRPAGSYYAIAALLAGAAGFNVLSPTLQGNAVEWSRFLLTGLPAGAIVFFIASTDVSSQASVPRILEWAGDRSYSIYLVHWPIIVGLSWLVQHYLGTNILAAIAFIIGGMGSSLTIAIPMFRFVEQPSHKSAKALSQTIKRAPIRERT